MYSRNRSIKNVYSPSMRKANVPNYFQQKGRTIQQSPLRMHDTPTEMITTRSLDKMYKMLLDYKYPIPRPLDNIPSPFVYVLYNTFATMFPGDSTQSHIYGPNSLRSQMEQVGDQLPVLPSNYHYEYRLAMFGVQVETACQENMQFHIDWNSNLCSQTPFQIFIKSVDPALGTVGMRVGAVTPLSAAQLYVPRMSATTGGGIQIQNVMLYSNDPNPSDQLYYPMIDTSARETDLYYGYLEMVPNSGYDNSPNAQPYIVLSVGCFPTINS